MTKEEFDRLYLDKAVHCDTEEKANEFLALAVSFGYRWISYSLWETHKEETCYEITKYGLMFSNRKNFKLDDYQIVEYLLQPKFKVGDKVRIKINNKAYSIDGKIGVVERDGFSRSRVEYVIKVCDEIWYLTENELEKIEEPTYKEETIDDIIEEIKDNQKSINVLLNRLERKAKNK